MMREGTGCDGAVARLGRRRRRRRRRPRRMVLLACDSSPVAVDTTRRIVGDAMAAKRDLANDDDGHDSTAAMATIAAPSRRRYDRGLSFEAFVADPSLIAEEEEGGGGTGSPYDDGDDRDDGVVNGSSFARRTRAAYERAISRSTSSEGAAGGGGSVVERGMIVGGGGAADGDATGVVGISLLIFVLSAVVPSRARRFLERVYDVTRAGGKVCFRDYGLYDMPMLRFEPSASCQYAASNNNGDGDDHDHDVSDPVFVRGEGTIARFFSIEAARSLFESVGFDTLELRYCTVYNRNRKTGQEMKRVFVHGVFQKPHHPPGA
ncbi:hypothetical protein ACHAW5_010727 [Stephanodiscus triporus]|uniref:Methyltransferase-like protein n=1 Tax=Stephanodiscus triporus TaxID=2934178 RepID=A0ABD3MFA5_9STRA